MAIHIPLSLEAQAEARLLMPFHTNLLSPATGDPDSVPSKNMFLGLYILTIEKINFFQNEVVLSPMKSSSL
jgi:DNA-directed RNA polymerase subunit beta'